MLQRCMHALGRGGGKEKSEVHTLSMEGADVTN